MHSLVNNAKLGKRRFNVTVRITKHYLSFEKFSYLFIYFAIANRRKEIKKN